MTQESSSGDPRTVTRVPWAPAQSSVSVDEGQLGLITIVAIIYKQSFIKWILCAAPSGWNKIWFILTRDNVDECLSSQQSLEQDWKRLPFPCVWLHAANGAHFISNAHVKLEWGWHGPN